MMVDIYRDVDLKENYTDDSRNIKNFDILMKRARGRNEPI